MATLPLFNYFFEILVFISDIHVGFNLAVKKKELSPLYNNIPTLLENVSL